MKLRELQKLERAKFARVHQVRAVYGLTDPTIYRLISARLIKSVVVQLPGTSRGTRLIELDSLDTYLATLAEAQAN